MGLKRHSVGLNSVVEVGRGGLESAPTPLPPMKNCPSHGGSMPIPLRSPILDFGTEVADR